MHVHDHKISVKVGSVDFLELIHGKIEEAINLAEDCKFIDDAAAMGMSSSRSVESIKSHIERNVKGTVEHKLMEIDWMLEQYFTSRGYDLSAMARNYRQSKEG